VSEEGHVCAVLALLGKKLSCGKLEKSQLGMGYHLHQVGVTHALKEREA
jgi:hypothetical protein